MYCTCLESVVTVLLWDKECEKKNCVVLFHAGKFFPLNENPKYFFMCFYLVSSMLLTHI